jgi:hypothetical protein
VGLHRSRRNASTKFFSNLLSRSSTSQALKLGNVICRPRPESGIGHLRCFSYSRQKRAKRKGSGIGKKSPPRPTGKLGERVSLLEALTSTERRVCGLGIRTLRKMCGAVRFKLRAKDALSVAVFRKKVVVLWVANSAGPKATSEGSSRLVISLGGNNARDSKRR